MGQKVYGFLSNYRSCYTGAPLTYLLRDDDAHQVAAAATYETLDMFLVASLQFNPAINLAFVDENKVMAAVLSRALGNNDTYASELTKLLGKGQGHAAWLKLKVRVNGTAKAVFARVQTLELKLKSSYNGTTKGFLAIQTHNSAFLKTVQDLASSGSAISNDWQIREYLMTIQDPILLPLKDSIRADGAHFTLDEVQQKFVDIVEGAGLMPRCRQLEAIMSSRSISRSLSLKRRKQARLALLELEVTGRSIYRTRRLISSKSPTLTIGSSRQRPSRQKASRR
jgi:hypothetical protein